MILYESNHMNRAINLANAVQEQSVDIDNVTGARGVPASGDKVLTVWGHGGPNLLANRSAAAIRDLILAWKARNPQLTTFEIVTCDSRHSENGTESFTDALLPLIIASNRVQVVVRTLPRGGSSATWSRLWAVETAGVDGYYFVAGQSQADLAQGEKVRQDAYSAVPASTPANQRLMASFPIAKAADDKAAQKGPLAYVCSSGSLSGLRDRLVPVTTYRQDGKVVAVPK